MLFHEHLRLGWWLPLEIACLILIVVGYVEIAKSPVATGSDLQPEPEAVPAGGGAGGGDGHWRATPEGPGAQ
jgi:hypothetical protein